MGNHGQRRHPTWWTLHLDESGQFSNPNEPVLLAGFLLQEPPSDAADEILGGLLRRIDPLIPYPPHATEILWPAWWFARWVLASPEVRAAHPARAVLDQAAGVFQRAGAVSALDEMSSQLQQSQTPDYDSLRDASRWLRGRDPVLYAQFEVLRRNAEDHYRAIGARLQTLYGDDRCWLLAASDPGAVAFDGPDRYLSLLTVLLERVFALLRAHPAPRHEVRVIAAQRHVTDGRVSRRRMLRPQDLGDCVRKAEAFPLHAPEVAPDKAVRIIPWSSVAYDEQVPPGVALADFVANRVRRILMQGRDWNRTSSDVVASTGLTAVARPGVRPSGEALPTVAVAGPPREAVAAAFRGPPPPRPPAPGRSWSAEQARRWITLADALRAEGAL